MQECCRTDKPRHEDAWYQTRAPCGTKARRWPQGNIHTYIHTVLMQRLVSCFIYVLAVPFLSFLCQPVSSSCIDPAANTTCAWYSDCLEAAHPCGSDGYALAYGQHYCNAFSSELASNLLTPHGLVWRDRTLLCLQEELVPLLNVTISCKVSMLPFVCVLKLTAFRTYDLKLSTRTRAATSRRVSVRLICTTGTPSV